MDQLMTYKPPDPLPPEAFAEADADARTPVTTMATRVPVFEVGHKIWGYDLLLSDIATEKDRPPPGTPKEAAALSNAFSLIVPFMGKNERLALPMSEDLILTNTAYMFPSEICCLNLRGRIKDAAALGRGLAELKQAGYLIMLSCPRQDPEWAEFLPLARVARVDLLEFEASELKLTVNWLKERGLEVLAQNVKPGQVEMCLEMGFKYLQGDMRTQSDVVSGKNFSSSQIVKARLLQALADPEWDVRDVAALIRADVSLAYRLLRYLNSAYFSLPSAITSIESSVLLLGRVGLEQWVYVTIFSDLGVGPLAKHIITTAAFRGKFLELLAAESNRPTPPPETLFMLGLFSMLEALLNMPLAEIVAEIKIDAQVTSTLQGKDTEYQPWFTLLLDYERGNWDGARHLAGKLGLTLHDTSMAYTRAMVWVKGIFD